MTTQLLTGGNDLDSLLGLGESVIDIKLAINDEGKPSQDEVMGQIKTIIKAYKDGQTTPYNDY